MKPDIPMLEVGYAHRLIRCDILGGALEQPVAMSRDELISYRAGSQFGELDIRSNKTFQIELARFETPNQGPLCDCWQWQEHTPDQPARFTQVGPGYPGCGHETGFGAQRRIHLTPANIKVSPRAIPILAPVNTEDLKVMVAHMRGYGWGFFNGTHNRVDKNNKFYLEYQNDMNKEAFMSRHVVGFQHGMDYHRSVVVPHEKGEVSV